MDKAVKSSAPHVAGIDKALSPLVLGTAFFSLDQQNRWFDLLDIFERSGGAILDSGHNYGDSEQLIGLWLESRAIRERMVICSKGGHGTGSLPDQNFEEVIETELNASLERLKTNYIDLYMLHRDNPEIPVVRIINCLNKYIKDRRVRALGASNWTYDRIRQANKYAEEHGLKGFAAVSNNLSLAVPESPFYPGLVSVDEAGLRWHIATSIPLFPWSSQARGFFTGAYSVELREQAGRVENGFTKRMIEVYCTDDNFERLKRATELGRKKGGYSAVEVALSWVLHKPFPIAPIVGPHSREELRSCIRALSLVLTDSESKYLNLEE